MSTIDPITGLTIPASVTDNSTAWTPPPLGVICTTITVNGKTVESNPPQIINSGDGQVKGGPTNPQICRGYIENTAISASNNNKVHVCDTTLYIRRKVNLGKIAEKVVIAARDALNWIMEFLGITPGGNGLVEQIKVWSIWLKEKITWIKEMLFAVESYVSIIREIRDVILYILSLPSQLIKYFQGCLQEAYAELAKQFSDAANQFGGSTDSELTDAVKELKTTLQDGYNTAQGAIVYATNLPNAILKGSNSAAQTTAAQDALGFDGKAEVSSFVTNAYANYAPQTDFKTA